MEPGYLTIKDIVTGVIIPILIFIIPFSLSTFQRINRRKTFKSLIMRELKELEPLDDPIGENMWYRHLSKRFLHEEILTKLSENRDFILSLNKDICYNGIQMWMHFHKAEKTTDDKLSKYHANEWLNYLKSFTISVKYPMATELHKKWDKVVKEFFGEVES